MEKKSQSLSLPLPENVPAKGEARRARYNRAVREARLVAILLSFVKFNVNRDVDYDGRISSLTLRYSGDVTHLHLDEVAGTLLIRVEWVVQIKVKRRVFAKCNAAYDVIYDGLGSEAKEISDEFASSVARPASYAYFRSLFSSLDWGAELRLPPLPVFKVQPRV